MPGSGSRKSILFMAGRDGLVDRAPLGSGDRARGVKAQSGFSSCFLLLLHFLYHGSFQSVAHPVWSFFGMQHYCRINSQPWKKNYRDQLVAARADPYEKFLASPSVRQKHWQKCDFGANKKYTFHCAMPSPSQTKCLHLMKFKIFQSSKCPTSSE